MVGTDALKKTRKDDDRSKKSKEEVRVFSCPLSAEGGLVNPGLTYPGLLALVSLWILMSSLQAFSVLSISANRWQCVVSVRSTKCAFYSQPELCAALCANHESSCGGSYSL